jgi:hypothetical protein
MIKYIILFMLISTTASASVISKMCVISEGRITVEAVSDLANDKAKHCSVSCIVAYNCSRTGSFLIGALKEFQDIFTKGDADWKDMKANRSGIKFSKIVDNENECFDACLEKYN